MDNVESDLTGGRTALWYQSIAGKLISAFILVAALTVAATLVALYAVRQYRHGHDHG